MYIVISGEVWCFFHQYFFSFYLVILLLKKKYNAARFSLWGLENWTHIYRGGCIMSMESERLLLLICPIIFSFFFLSNFQTLKIMSHFSQELWGLEDWNLVHMWTEGGCIVYTGMYLSLYCFIFLSNFWTFKFFVTLFSGTVRPRRLKLGTRMNSGWMYRANRNQTATSYLSLQFSNIKNFCHTFLRSCDYEV